jgi:ABC transport system ATP-binding/permease protein
MEMGSDQDTDGAIRDLNGHGRVGVAQRPDRGRLGTGMPELLLSCQDLTISFGAAPLFQELSFGIFEGDHIGLLGPNGSGKSTLLKILAGLEPPSSGTRITRKRLRIGYVPQDPSFPPDATVASVLGEAARGLGVEDHEAGPRIAVAMAKGGFAEPAQAVATLSGGWKKRLIIARELAREPELLLLDEPTNHFDLEGILWLEELMQREPEAFLAVSHDRYFLEAAAGRVLELNRAFPSGLLDVRERYSQYLREKDEFLAGQASYQESLQNRVRGEIQWISRKAKAGTRKSQARIAEVHRLRNELADLDRRARLDTVGIDFAGTERKTMRLLIARALAMRFGGRTVLRKLDLVLSPGARLGLLGANGSGKTTLLRLLAGVESPTSGTIERAPGLRVVMFDQHRSQLDPATSLRRTLAPSGNSVVNQGREIHVAGWDTWSSASGSRWSRESWMPKGSSRRARRPPWIRPWRPVTRRSPSGSRRSRPRKRRSMPSTRAGRNSKGRSSRDPLLLGGAQSTQISRSPQIGRIALRRTCGPALGLTFTEMPAFSGQARRNLSTGNCG